MIKIIKLVSSLEKPRRAGWSVRGHSTSVSTGGGRHEQFHHSSLDSCMLGLRPRLVTRPSLLDLVTKKDSDRAAVLSPVEQDSLSIDLPQSPVAASSTTTTTTTAMAPSRDVESQQGESSLSLLNSSQADHDQAPSSPYRGMSRRPSTTVYKPLMPVQSRHYRREHDRCCHVRTRTYQFTANTQCAILRNPGQSRQGRSRR